MSYSYKSYIDPILHDTESMVKTLVEWANINSYSYNFSGLEKMRKRLKKDFSILPVDIEEVCVTEEESSLHGLRAICRPEAPIQVFLNGHMDTVYDLDHSIKECIRLDENRLQGPGVADMKGGLLVMLKALEAFEKCPWKDRIGWQVFINPDEEVGSLHSDKFFKEAAKMYHLGLIFESSPPDGSLVRARRGTGKFIIRVHGKEAHAGRDFDKGKNAIVAAAKMILKFDALNQFFPDATFNVGFVEGGGAAINIVPALATVKVDVRYSKIADKEKILAKIGEILKLTDQEDGIRTEVDGGFKRLPKEVSPAIEEIFHDLESCGKDLGMNLRWKDSGGASDGNNLAAYGLPNIDSLGVCGGNIHSSEEFVFIDSLAKRAQLTALFLMKLATGEIILSKEIF